MQFRISALMLALVFMCSVYADAQQVLLIPRSDDDVVGAFSPVDGSLIDADFIVSTGEMVVPFNAIDSGRQTIFVSDQVGDEILEYDLDGTFIGIAFDSSNGIDNVRGIAVANGQLYATIGAGAFAGTIQQYDLQTGAQTTLIPTLISGSGVAPFDIHVLPSSFLVANVFAGAGQVESYDSTGVFEFEFDSTIEFPEQISETANGEFLVGGFSAPEGIYRYSASGIEIGFLDTDGESVRGVFELGNGNILYTTPTGVFVVEPNTGIITQIESGNFRFIESVMVNLGGGGPGNGCTQASQFTVFRGVQLGGTLDDSFDSDDSFQSYRPGFTISEFEAPVWLIFDATLAGTPTVLSFVVESNAGTPGLTTTTEAFNHVTQQFDIVDVRAETFNTDSIADIDISSGIANYVDAGGNVQSRIGWRQTGFTVNFPWEVRLDQAIWKSD